MESLVWEEKLVRIKAFSIRKETRGFIHVECFNTHSLLPLQKDTAHSAESVLEVCAE